MSTGAQEGFNAQAEEEKLLATDTSEEEEAPMKVEIINQPKEKKPKNPTSIDTIDEYDYIPTEEQIKEMTDAQ